MSIADMIFGEVVNLKAGKLLALKGEKVKVSKKCSLEALKIEIINSEMNLGKEAHFIAEQFYCKNSKIIAQDIYLPAQDHLYNTNCEFIGKVHFNFQNDEL
ncbi:hypothetical protein NF27_CG00540 [Candidatus Jidaibacter acanthamoeba]|uniref:Uncharacterized protein n=1 Tax=Candidatus Jidaibacter acanthamoebae TaxID=86105 RepID=A0A0C1QK09_9RICK|nr:hypothetical protein [Candidatus Jidaibacter acanthamoeba]KIE05874.1 hypothetical protein NF27_CG00540 [Candidatus Jidaibacter acanthamoeba]